MKLFPNRDWVIFSMVTLYYDKCKGVSNCSYDGICFKECLNNAIEIKDDFPIINEELCSGCGLCILNCPNEALSK